MDRLLQQAFKTQSRESGSVVGLLPTTCEAIGSIPSPANRKDVSRWESTMKMTMQKLKRQET